MKVRSEQYPLTILGPSEEMDLITTYPDIHHVGLNATSTDFTTINIDSGATFAGLVVGWNCYAAQTLGHVHAHAASCILSSFVTWRYLLTSEKLFHKTIGIKI